MRTLRRESPFRTLFPWRTLAMLVVLGAVQYALAQQQQPSTGAAEPATPAGTPVPSSSPPQTQQPTGAPATPPSSSGTSTAGESKTGDAAAEPGDTSKPTPTPDKPAAAKGSVQRFEPTEKVRPDFDVAFPIDI
jgi:cytoskeletal protein RodZ